MVDDVFPEERNCCEHHLGIAQGSVLGYNHVNCNTWPIMSITALKIHHTLLKKLKIFGGHLERKSLSELKSHFEGVKRSLKVKFLDV